MMQQMTPEVLNALSAAAHAKGGPLTDAEREAVYRGHTRAALRERFLKVIRGAGYSDGISILNEYFDQYMADIPNFVKMLEEYEKDQAEQAAQQARTRRA